jgi:hypothetical protein
MALSAKDKGFVQANIGIPYPFQQLSGMLVISEELLKRTIERCKQVGKIIENEDKTYFLPSWQEYKLSDRHRRRFVPEEEQMSSKADTMAEKTGLKKKRIEKNRREMATKSSTQPDEEFWNEVKKIYYWLDIDLQVQKMKGHMLTPKGKSWKMTRRRVIAWLNREDRPVEVKKPELSKQPPVKAIDRDGTILEQGKDF